MPRVDLSVLIPSRNEMFLAKTVENILENIQGNTEIIIVADGNWPDPPVPDNSKVTMIYHPEAIGQRAATNEAAKLSRAKFIMKSDAHCSFAKGFDVTLMADCEYDWTIVPRMYNLHAFNWKCKDCGNETYQGPTPQVCQKCGHRGEFERVILWKEKHNPESDFFRFDKELHFQYWREFKKRPEAQPDLAPTMSLLGACWFMHRQRYWDLDGSDEETGSWGQMGTEITCKSWLSGGKLLVNKKTWFSHLFRTQGGDFGFPYPNPGIKTARKRSHYLWIGNNWEKQIYPLSWILDKFWPIPDWTDADRAKISEAGSVFLASKSLANSANTFSVSANTTISHEMTPPAMGSSTPKHVLMMSNNLDMGRVATSPVVTDNMVEFQTNRDDANQPIINKSMNTKSSVLVEKFPVSGVIQVSSPVPATSGTVNTNIRKQTSNGSTIQGGNHGNSVSQTTGIVKGMLYYTDNQLDERIMKVVQKNLEYQCNGHRLVSVSLKPMSFGENIVLPLRRGHLAMAKQQLAGLEKLDTDIVFMVEHDIIYPACHFDFIPPRKDVFYYDLNWWKVRQSDGQALHFKAKQVSGLCAYRDILIEYYRNRVKLIESGEIGGRRHFEPGSHYRDAYNKLTTHGFDTWFSEIPYVDIRHGTVVTRNIFDPSGYRGQVTDWTMADEIPYWGISKGRFNEFLDDIEKRIGER